MKTISIFGFRGAGTEEDLKNNPTMPIDVVAGHMGYSFDHGKTIWGFGPYSTESSYDLMVSLIEGCAYPGKVTDDTYIFDYIRNNNFISRDNTKQSVFEIKVKVTDVEFDQIVINHESMFEYNKTYSINEGTLVPRNPLYAFPSNNLNVYNCVTYLKLIGIPLPDLSGNIRELENVK